MADGRCFAVAPATGCSRIECDPSSNVILATQLASIPTGFVLKVQNSVSMNSGLAWRQQAALVPTKVRAPPTIIPCASSTCSTSSSFTESPNNRRGAIRGTLSASRPRPRPSVVAASEPVGRAASGPVRKLDNVYDVVVVGGGISGLTTALALTTKHGMSNYLVTESRERVGGNITSLRADGYTWEEGPNSFQPSDSVLQIAVS